MKDYDHVILWLDYFNRSISKRKGRKVIKKVAIYDPTIDELEKACKRLGLKFEDDSINSEARYPRRPYVRSGYVMLPKTEKKSTIIHRVGKTLQEMRNSGRK
jgi:signal recognition particle subunit SRP19